MAMGCSILSFNILGNGSVDALIGCGNPTLTIGRLDKFIDDSLSTDLGVALRRVVGMLGSVSPVMVASRATNRESELLEILRLEVKLPRVVLLGRLLISGLLRPILK